MCSYSFELLSKVVATVWFDYKTLSLTAAAAILSVLRHLEVGVTGGLGLWITRPCRTVMGPIWQTPCDRGTTQNVLVRLRAHNESCSPY